jgi:hypothetical protein
MLLVTTFVERLFFCARWIVLAQPAEAQGPPKTGLGRLHHLITSDVERAGSGLDWRRQPRGALTAWTAAPWRLTVCS